jgi:hypothetical protein
MKAPDKPDDRADGPRRGAVPTPKEIIDAAKPFVPPFPARPKAPKPEA